MIDKVTLAGTDLKISRLSFGTASLHHLHSSRARQAILEAAFEIGISHFDTSPYYGFGLAELELGALRKRLGGAITVATKVGLYPPDTCFPGVLSVWARKTLGKAFPRISAPRVDWAVAAARASLETSLRRLKTDCVDILFLHEPNHAVVSSDDFLEWLEAERRQGKLRYWGLAGQPLPMGGWLRDAHPLGTILQVKDSLDRREADAVFENGRVLQITYGYLSSSRENPAAGSDKGRILVDALKRNRTGSVLFSTRRLDRLRTLSDRCRVGAS